MNTPQRDNNYGEFRPNDRFLTVESRLAAQRVSRKIEEAPDFNKYKYLLIMEGMGCDMSRSQRAFLNSNLGMSYDDNRYEHSLYGVGDVANPEQAAPLMYAFGAHSGFTATDWSLQFKATSPIFNTGDQGIAVLAGGELLRSVAQSENDLKPFVHLDKYNTELWGEHYACMDELGGGIKLPQDQTNIGCKLLSDKADRVISAIGAGCSASPLQDVLPKVPDLAEQFPSIEAKRKYQLVQDKCSSCHGNSFTPDGFKNSRFGGLTKQQFIDKATMRVNSKDPDVRMPFGKPPLDSDQIQDALDYLKTLVP